MSDSLWPHELQHARPPGPSPTARVHPNPCPLSWWCLPTISSSVIPFSSCPQSFPASGSFQMSQFFALGGQNIGASASASVLPINIQDWSPLGLTGLILKFKGLLRDFSISWKSYSSFYTKTIKPLFREINEWMEGYTSFVLIERLDILKMSYLSKIDL